MQQNVKSRSLRDVIYADPQKPRETKRKRDDADGAPPAKTRRGAEKAPEQDFFEKLISEAETDVDVFHLYFHEFTRRNWKRSTLLLIGLHICLSLQ